MMSIKDISSLPAQLSSKTFGESRPRWGMRYRSTIFWLRLGCRAVCYNEIIYPSPGTYDPERFLKDGQLDLSLGDPADRIFGFGRR